MPIPELASLIHPSTTGKEVEYGHRAKKLCVIEVVDSTRTVSCTPYVHLYHEPESPPLERVLKVIRS